MIEEFEVITSELTVPEKEVIGPLVVRGLKNHIGKKEAITGVEILKAIETHLGIKLNGVRLRKIIYWLQVTEQITCLCSCQKGYFVAADEKEMKASIASLTDRIDTQTFKRDVLIQQFNNRKNEIK